MSDEMLKQQKEYPFEFSVIMAVYNVEPFLQEAIDSLTGQDFGFEKIQLIMVDDGSEDGSGAICDACAAQYPDNVIVIHKENGGVSSARNEGLKYAAGRYLNFMDADDKLAIGTMRKIHKFFKDHWNETDVVAIPMRFFDGASGQHRLNTKFKKGNRIIHLLKEWKTVQLSCSSAFIKAEAAEEMHFDPALSYCEDGKEMQKILVKRMTLGVIRHTTYLYRKRSLGSRSAVQSSTENLEWYLPYLKGFTASTISFCLEKLNYIPRFIQYTIMYDLQWRILQEHLPEMILDAAAANEYKKFLFSLLPYIEDEVIMAQQDIQIEHKAFLLKKKYNRDADIMYCGRNAMLHYQNTCLSWLNTNKTHLNFITLTSDFFRIEGYTVLIAEKYADVKIFLDVNGTAVPCTIIERNMDKFSLDEAIYYVFGFEGSFKLESEIELYKIYIYCEINGYRVNKSRFVYGKYCPVSTKYKNGYYYNQGHVLTAAPSSLQVRKCGRKGYLKREKAFLKELWDRNRVGERKAVYARLFTAITKPLLRKKIWIVCDRVAQADDNGEAFFKYLNRIRPKDINIYYAISPNSADYNRLKKIGKVVPFLEKKYKLLYLLADCVISSQGEEYIFHPFQNYFDAYRGLSQSQKFIFLQHGVIKDDLSSWLNRYNKNISLFVTTTQPEYQSILDCNYYYTSDTVKLTGLPRYDRLIHDEKFIIAIMPTWRAYLVGGLDPQNGKRNLKSGFTDSSYYKMYTELLNCTELFDKAEKLGYTIAFLNHPNMTAAGDLLAHDDRLKILDNNTPYRTIFAESNLLITDYSSVAFDFAYLRKPVIYFQADYEEFFSGAHTYEKGYFDYERDGFGEVEHSAETLVSRMIAYMENGCQLSDTYRKRIDDTFPFSDQNNCQRVYEEILKL